MSSPANIPFLDMVTPHLELEEDLCGVFRSALRTAGFIGGPMVEGFEQEFAQFCDADYCIGVASGTDALLFALIGAGVLPGDLVVTVPNTFIATAEAISQSGAQPVFVDIDALTYNMDAGKLREYLENECRFDQTRQVTVHRESGRSVSAVVPVHLYGQMADMDAIMEVADCYNLVVVEDACQAHGAQYLSSVHNQWKKAGSIGRAGAFSFYPGKNLGACGEAGAVITNDPELAKKVRMLRDHGQARKYYHDLEGYNGRLDAIQAGILNVKLQHLPTWNAKRRENAARYQEMFSDVRSVKLQDQPTWSKSVFHLFVIEVEQRDGLQRHLTNTGIGTGIHYPIPLHLQNAYRHFPYRLGDFPITEKTAKGLLSLPMYPGLEAEQQIRIVDQVQMFASQSGRELTMAAVSR